MVEYKYQKAVQIKRKEKGQGYEELVKRLLSVMAATAMVVSMLSGCGSSGESGDERRVQKRSFSV